MLDLKMKRIQVTLKNPENGKLLRFTAVRIKLHTYIFISIIIFLISWVKFISTISQNGSLTFSHFSGVNT